MKAIVIGATGAIGKDLVKILLEDDTFERVDIFVRREVPVPSSTLVVHVVDFDHPEQWADQLTGDVLFSCLGTTIKAAGSQEAQWKVDYKSLELGPDIVLIMLGTNDTKRRNWDPEVFRRDYRRLVGSYEALPSQPRVILIAPIRIFRVGGIPLMGLFPQIDGVHPQREGARMLADAIFSAVRW